MAHYDLVIIGTGSGNSIPGPAFDDWNIAIVEAGTFGGTCLNVGCIPSKMFEYPAEVADALRGAEALGVHGHIDKVDWPAIRDRIFGRIDPIAESGKRYREGDRCPNITVYTGTGRFTGHKAMTVQLADGGAAQITADRFVLAAGSRAVIPDIPGLDTVAYHTSDTVMRIDDLPARVLIVGGGYIAAEFGHVFASLGAAVTQVARGERLLRHLDSEVAQRYTDVTAARYDVHLGSTVTSVAPTPRGHDAVLAEITGPAGDVVTVEADLLLIATGRRPNGDELGVTATGVRLDPDGYVEVDEHQQTAAAGIWALGDVSSRHQLKHVANHEARVVAHNLAHPDKPIAADHRYVPAAVFTHPQIATAGLTEDDATARGVDYVTGRRDYGGVAAGWAREDTTGFCKVLADPATGLLLGVHIIGPEAATVIQPALTAMQFGIPAHELARGQYWIHPALPEVLENALLELPEPTGRP
jgi:mycothione reductase